MVTEEKKYYKDKKWRSINYHGWTFIDENDKNVVMDIPANPATNHGLLMFKYADKRIVHATDDYIAKELTAGRLKVEQLDKKYQLIPAEPVSNSPSPAMELIDNSYANG